MLVFTVRFVIHFDPPHSLEQYIQGSGRAGRDGDPADAILREYIEFTPGSSNFVERDPIFNSLEASNGWRT